MDLVQLINLFTPLTINFVHSNHLIHPARLIKTMLKLTIFCALFVAATATGKCYDGDYKMTAFSMSVPDTDGKEVKTDLMSVIPASDKTFSKDSVKTCGENEACFSYSVSATADFVVTDEDKKDEEGAVIKTTAKSNMEIKAMSCLPADTNAEANISEAICDEWEKGLIKSFADDDSTKDIVSNVQAACAKPVKCDGDKCVLEADRSSAATFGLTAIFLTFFYLF